MPSKAYIELVKELFSQEGKEEVVIPSTGNKMNAARELALYGLVDIEDIPSVKLEKKVVRKLKLSERNKD